MRFNKQENASRVDEWDRRSPLCTVVEQVVEGATESKDLDCRTRTEVRVTGLEVRFRMEFHSRVVAWQLYSGRLSR